MTALLRIPAAPCVMLYQGVALALSQIWANKLRAVLTTLGILIGVAAVSAVIALIDGMKNRVLAEFEAFGTNKVFISPKPRKSDIGARNAWAKICFRNDLFDGMLAQCPSVESFTRHAGYGGLPVAYRSQVAEDRVQFNGVDPEWHRIARRGVVSGRPLTEMDSRQIRRVCLISAKLRDELKLDLDPSGEIIDIAYFGRMLVVGVVEPPASMSGSDADTGELLVPFTFSTTRYNWPTWYSVAANIRSREKVEEAKGELEFYLRQARQLRPGEEENFQVNTPQRTIDEVNEVAAYMTVIAGGIVAVSLLVGGVGIMNIMLVSVSERTREIGLRKAVGARPAAIMTQFLIEAVVLCLLGGALGLLAGQGLTSTVAAFLPANLAAWDHYNPKRDSTLPDSKQGHDWNIVVPPLAVAVAFGFSGTVGLIFGLFPAIKAARLDPIEALRHE